MKTVLLSLVTLISLTLSAAPKALIIEKASHELMKLGKTGKLPAEFTTKLHMTQVAENADGTYTLTAVLDHNEDHSQTPAHAKLVYSHDGKVQSFVYVQGYFNPAPSVFSGASTAKLFDLAAEVLLDSNKKELLAYAETVTVMELEFDKAKNAALFKMVDSNKKSLSLWLDLQGNVLEYKFE
jgi:hypothetical protein